MKELMNTRLLLLVLFLTLLGGCASAPDKSSDLSASSDIKLEADTDFESTNEEQAENKKASIHIIANWEDPISFLGYVDTHADASSGSGVLYSGDAGAAGLLVQIFAHAAINSSMQKKKLDAKQEAANHVLAEYLEVIDKLSHTTLFEVAQVSELGSQHQIRKATEASEVPEGDIVALIVPEYYLSPDKRSIMLKLALNAYSSSDLEPSVYQRSVKVISGRVDDTSSEDMWLDGAPSYFETTAHSLFVEGLDVLLGDYLSAEVEAQEPKKTYSYQFGERKRYERATLLKETCDRLYLKDLKKDFVVIPTTSECEVGI